MCWSCGCGSPTDDHGDSRHITTMHLRSAAEAADKTVPQVVANIAQGLANWRGRSKAAAKSDGDEAPYMAFEVFKSTPERQYTLGVAYPANRPDVGVAADGFRDFASPQVLEDAAWSFLTKSANVGLDHAEGTDGAGRVVESYLYRGPDWEQTNGYVVKSGDWLVGILWNDVAWKSIKNGERTGLSPQGAARRRIPTADAVAHLRTN